MAPSAEKSVASTTTTPVPNKALLSSSSTHSSSSSSSSLDKKTICFATNYQVGTSSVYLKPSTTKTTVAILRTPTTSTPSTTRRPRRRVDPKQPPLSRVRVKYDMEVVPSVERDVSFWNHVITWPPRCRLRMQESSSGGSTSNRRRTTTTRGSTEEESTTPPPPPFAQHSCLWIPSKRKEWEDCIGELTAVCTSAERRKFVASPSKVFVPPLSREYIRDRIDIDDPLRGFQIRHAKGGWLQGYILWTNFTTWTHYFTWDSLHPQAGVVNDSVHPKDENGALANELQALTRSGDPSDSGIVFPNVAEIALLGGLGGCGELLLRMALEDILARGGQYQYVVLQATTSSRSFYERFGFVRVGAVCRYGSSSSATTGKGVPASHSSLSTIPTLETPIQGYRHWTHANESQVSLDLHGGPSYMMCLKLPSTTSIPKGNLLEILKDYTVQEKPTVRALGAASTPSVMRKIKTHPTHKGLLPAPMLPSLAASAMTPTAKPKRVYSDIVPSGGGASPSFHPTTRPWTALNNTPTTPATGTSSSSHNHNSGDRPVKRRKVSEDFAKNTTSTSTMTTTNDFLITPPPSGQALSYAQKQYQSVWLAVPPQEKVTQRKPPKPRQASTTAVEDSVVLPMAAATTPTKMKKTLGKKTKSPKKKSPTTKTKGNKTMKKKTSSPVSQDPNKLVVNHQQAVLSNKIQTVDKTILCKQKVKSYPRDRPHFYNKVVQAKTTNSHNNPTYYFVLHYSELHQQLLLCPMAPTGRLSGKRQGRPRFQCVLEDQSTNWRIGSTTEYVVVAANMIMKTPLVAQEAWDVVAVAGVGVQQQQQQSNGGGTGKSTSTTTTRKHDNVMRARA